MMAGYWIKWEKGLVRKPEIMEIALSLEVSDQHAAACCMMVWEWADDVTIDGLIRAKPDAIDRVSGQPGLASAMEACGWLVVSDSAIQFPNYDRHNGQNAKRRATEASRQGKHRNHKPPYSVTHRP